MLSVDSRAVGVVAADVVGLVDEVHVVLSACTSLNRPVHYYMLHLLSLPPLKGRSAVSDPQELGSQALQLGLVHIDCLLVRVVPILLLRALVSDGLGLPALPGCQLLTVLPLQCAGATVHRAGHPLQCHTYPPHDQLLDLLHELLLRHIASYVSILLLGNVV